MRAITMQGFGGPEVLIEGQRPDPQPAAGELLVRVSASGVNRPDVLQRKGAYAPPPGASDLPGLEIAGVIAGGDAAALAAAGFRLGDRVCALVAGGGYPSGLPIPRILAGAALPGAPRAVELRQVIEDHGTLFLAYQFADSAARSATPE